MILLASTPIWAVYLIYIGLAVATGSAIGTYRLCMRRPTEETGSARGSGGSPSQSWRT